MALRRDGKNASAYLGVTAITPPQFETHPRAPGVNDIKNFEVGTIWLDTSNTLLSPALPPASDDIYMLVSKRQGVATWVNFGDGEMRTLTGDTGGAVSPDAAGNIDILGTAGQIDVTGTPASNLLTLSLDGAVALQFDTDAGTAVPALGVLTVAGGTNINTAGAGSTVTVNLNDAILVAISVSTPLYTAPSGDVVLNMTDDIGTNSVSFTNDSDSEVASVSSLGGATFTELDVDNINVDANTISSTNTNGNIILDPDGTGTVNVTYGTQYNVLLYGASGALSEVGSVGTSGQVLTSNGAGANPSWQAAATGGAGGLTGRGPYIYDSSFISGFISIFQQELTGGTPSDTESNCQIPVAAGTFSNLFVRVISNTSSADMDWVLRVNGADTALTTTVTGLTTGIFSDTSNTVAVSNGDLVCLKFDVPPSNAVRITFTLTYTAS